MQHILSRMAYMLGTYCSCSCSILLNLMLFIKGLITALAGMAIVKGTCPRPAFTGDQTSPMSPTQMLKRAARRPGGVPLQSDVYASANVVRIQRVLPEVKFNALFPRANRGLGPGVGNGPYTYYNFLMSASMWPSFCSESAVSGTDLDKLCLKELASMFAHFSQEVGEHDVNSVYPTWQQGLYHYTEMGCSDDPSVPGCEYRGGTCDSTTWMGQTWPCPAGVKYFGRGAKQLSYNFNYGPFSYALFGDVNVLLKNPSLVVANDNTNGWMAFASAFWFYMTPQSPKPSMHDVVAGFWAPSAADLSANRVPGFGVLIMIINGGIECGGSVEVAQAANRIEFYKGFLTALGLPAENSSTMTCTHMQQFDASSSAFVPSYWEQGWSLQSCGSVCQLVSYQTGFSIFDDPNAPDIPYNKCLAYYFGPTTTANPLVSTTSAVPTTSAPAFACNGCSGCVAVPGNSQACNDSQCAPCANGGQSWWPCNQAGLCQCSSTVAPSSTSTSTPTSAPSSTIASSTTVPTTTTNSNACGACDACIAVPNNGQAATDSMCLPCARNGQSWWPCNVSGLCQCGSPGSPTTGPSTTISSTSTSAGSPSNACKACATCVAIPGNYQAATDAMCAPCGSGTQQQWWPCLEVNTCMCASNLRTP